MVENAIFSSKIGVVFAPTVAEVTRYHCSISVANSSLPPCSSAPITQGGRDIDIPTETVATSHYPTSQKCDIESATAGDIIVLHMSRTVPAVLCTTSLFSSSRCSLSSIKMSPYLSRRSCVIEHSTISADVPGIAHALETL